VLFRKEEADMRQRLVEADLVECVLGLGPNLFYNSPMEACVVVCRTQKPPERRGRILFIDAVNEVARERAQSSLKVGHQTRILDAYGNLGAEPDFAVSATVDDIAEQGYSLSIPLYVKRVNNVNGSDDGRSLPELWAAWMQDGRLFWQEMDALVEMLDGMQTGEVSDA
jgi:type I restriction enzyme M protein